MVDWNREVPWGYQTAYRTLREVEQVLLAHYHPEYVRRLIGWLDAQHGDIGVGGTWRAGGAQPDQPGYAPEGKSFHQDQNYNDGFTGACAVDLVARNPGQVHRAPRWDEVPAQGSPEAATWGVHCNVGAPPSGEPWHMQPVEIDGWQSWWNAGRPAPEPNYSIPSEDTMKYFRISGDDAVWYTADGVVAVRVDADHYKAAGRPTAGTVAERDAVNYLFVDTVNRQVVT